VGGRGEKRPKQCMHIGINEKKSLKSYTSYRYGGSPSPKKLFKNKIINFLECG
jgi:hypothetical protein